MTKLEEIAKAIFDAWALANGVDYTWKEVCRAEKDHGRYPEISRMRGDAMLEARAVVEAMMSPSEAMIKSGADYRMRTAISGENNWHDDTKALFQAMLRAILDEKTES